MRVPSDRVLRRLAPWAAMGAALGPALYLWGFTVDDALITARYASHLARGLGYRFNAEGPVSDGVTPLGFAYLTSLFAGQGRDSVLQAFFAAKLIGVGSWLAAAAFIGAAVARVSDKALRFGALLLLVASAPLGAWSAAGMETGLVLSLAGFAAALPHLGYARPSAALAGLAAGLRPELLPWAIGTAISSLFAGPSIQRTESDAGKAGSAPSFVPSFRSRGAWAIGLSLAPFVLVALLRFALFGRAAPLSVYAKAPDPVLGFRYALACFLLTGPIAILAPWVWWTKLSRYAQSLVFTVFVHFIAIAAAGGDWMPLSRLAVPVLPTVIIAAAHILSHASLPASAARMAIVLSADLFVFARWGPQAAVVMRDRMELMQELGPSLASARVVAALDIGWAGAVTEATLVDLAGVTDPDIAALPGGHTSKQIPLTLLDTRHVDTLVLLLADGAELKTPWTESRFARASEQRIAFMPSIAEEFSPVKTSSLPRLRYVVLRRQSEATAFARCETCERVLLDSQSPLGENQQLCRGLLKGSAAFSAAWRFWP